jgi:hypothetical protein
VTRPRGLLTALLASLLCLAAPARAGDRIYWADRTGGMVPPVAFANLDGSGGADLVTTGATPGYAEGLTIDAAAGRVYWANGGAAKISFAKLDSSGGGGDLVTTGATVNGPNGLSIDPLGGRIYWANGSINKISFAALNGSGGGDLNTTGATVSSPLGTTVDPASGRTYWANNGGSVAIAFANLNGSGGGDLNTTGATVSSPWGLALDVAAGRVYWANSGGNDKISFAKLDGSGGGDLATPGATVNSPAGPAIDSAANRIYWANNNTGKISFASLDGSGGGDLNTTGTSAGAGNPNFVALLKSPAGAGAPGITGPSVPGSLLFCSQGSWAPDLLGSFLYRAPQSFAFQWTLDGAEIPGATATSLVADTVGTYRCVVTASNVAGSASQTSDGHVVALPTFGARTLVSLRLASRRIPAEGPIRVRVRNRNGFAIRGRLSGRTARKVNASARRVVKLRAKRFRVRAVSRKTVKLALPRPLRQLLSSKGKLRLRLTAKVRDPAGVTRTVRKRVSLRLKH